MLSKAILDILRLQQASKKLNHVLPTLTYSYRHSRSHQANPGLRDRLDSPESKLRKGEFTNTCNTVEHVISMSVTPWPLTGVRRASFNSFGIGGSNAHVVLDDAFHYLKIRGITGIHRTTEDPQSKSTKDATNGVVNGQTYQSTIENKINGLVSIGSNGIPDVPSKAPSPLSRPRVFVFSAFDEAGLGRLLAAYHHHLLHKSTSSFDEEAYLDDPSYTLAMKRTSFHWRASVPASSL